MLRSIRKFVSHILDEAALWGHVASDAVGILDIPLEEDDIITTPEPKRNWSVTWVVAKGHRAVVGHRTNVNLNELVPNGLIRGHVLATGLTEAECKKFVNSVGPVSDLSPRGVRNTHLFTGRFTETPVFSRPQSPPTLSARGPPEGVVRSIIREDYTLRGHGLYGSGTSRNRSAAIS